MDSRIAVLIRAELHGCNATRAGCGSLHTACVGFHSDDVEDIDFYCNSCQQPMSGRHSQNPPGGTPVSRHPMKVLKNSKVFTTFTLIYRPLYFHLFTCNIRLLQSHMRLKKNRPYNHWLKSQGHYLLCFSTSRTVGANSVRLRHETRTRYSLKATTKIPPHSRNKNVPILRSRNTQNT